MHVVLAVSINPHRPQSIGRGRVLEIAMIRELLDMFDARLLVDVVWCRSFMMGIVSLFVAVSMSGLMIGLLGSRHD